MSQHLFFVKLLLIGSLAAWAMNLPASAAEEFSAEELEAARDLRKEILADLESRLDVVQEQRRIAIQRKIPDDAKRLVQEIKSLKDKIRDEQKKPLEHYAAAAREEEDARMAELEEKAREREAMKVLPSMRELADCGPLAIHDCQMIKNSLQAMVKTYGAFEVSRMGGFSYEGHPILIVTVVSTTGVAVESYEVCFEVKDSFGKVVGNRRTGEVLFSKQNTLLEPLHRGKTDTVINWGGKEYRDAFTAVAWVSRVRLVDGTVWQQTREEAASKKYGIRESDRVEVFTMRHCRDDKAEAGVPKPN